MSAGHLRHVALGVAGARGVAWGGAARHDGRMTPADSVRTVRDQLVSLREDYPRAMAEFAAKPDL